MQQCSSDVPQQRKADMGIKVNRTDAPEYEPMEPGPYTARVKELEEQEDGQFGPSVRIKFEILNDDEYKDHIISGFASLKVDEDTGDYTFWPGTKLWEWATALRGGDEPYDLEDLDDLIDAECTIIVVQKKKKDGTVGDKISEVLAPRKKGGKKSNKQEEEVELNEQDLEDLPF